MTEDISERVERLERELSEAREAIRQTIETVQHLCNQVRYLRSKRH